MGGRNNDANYTLAARKRLELLFYTSTHTTYSELCILADVRKATFPKELEEFIERHEFARLEGDHHMPIDFVMELYNKRVKHNDFKRGLPTFER